MDPDWILVLKSHQIPLDFWSLELTCQPLLDADEAPAVSLSDATRSHPGRRGREDPAMSHSKLVKMYQRIGSDQPNGLTLRIPMNPPLLRSFEWLCSSARPHGRVKLVLFTGGYMRG